MPISDSCSYWTCLELIINMNAAYNYFITRLQFKKCPVFTNPVPPLNNLGLASQDVPFSPKNPNLHSSLPFSSSKLFSHSRVPS